MGAVIARMERSSRASQYTGDREKYHAPCELLAIDEACRKIERIAAWQCELCDAGTVPHVHERDHQQPVEAVVSAER